MGQLNIIGRIVIKLRFERGWSQETLAARLQCQRDDISRDVLANIETGRTQVTDKHLEALQRAFEVEIVRFFPKSTQERDAIYASRGAGRIKQKSPQRRHYYRR